jgi:hypothetical protein
LGGLGIVAGVAFTVAAEELPSAFIARMVKLYSTPLVSPVKLQVRLVLALQDAGVRAVGDALTE